MNAIFTARSLRLVGANMPAGRPLQFETPEVMQEAIDAYFTDCELKEQPPTVTGLALALDLTREGLVTYEGRDAFSDTVKRAKLRVQSTIEAGLLKGYNATGAIFNLKNNFGWKDKQEQEISGPGGGPIDSKITVEFVGADDE